MNLEGEEEEVISHSSGTRSPHRDSICSFVPVRVTDLCEQEEWKPTIGVFDGVVLFADISGFTALTERLAREGPAGAELLVSFLNEYFGSLITLIRQHGGDVAKFSGDALLALWPGSQQETQDDLPTLTLRAVQCSLEIQRMLDARAAEEPQLPLLHIGIGAGSLALLMVGGMYQRSEFVIAGPPMQQIAEACPFAQGREVVVSKEAWALLGDCCSGEVVCQDGEPTGNMLVTAVTHPIPVVGLDERERAVNRNLDLEFEKELEIAMRHTNLSARHTAATAGGFSDEEKEGEGEGKGSGVPRRRSSGTRSRDEYSGHRLSVVEEYAEDPDSPVVSRFIPGAALHRVGGTSLNSAWIAEMRRVSVMFISVKDLDYASPHSLTNRFLQQVDRVMRVLQTALYRYEGNMNKLLIDDKGFVVVAAFGLHPFKHEDDPARALLAALLIHGGLADNGVGCSIGVTTGRCFCGVVGNEQRREYTLMGDTVNTSARLMASTQNEIRCDEFTASHAQARVDLQAMDTLKLKGKIVSDEKERKRELKRQQ